MCRYSIVSENYFIGVLFKSWLLICIVISLVSCESETNLAVYKVVKGGFTDALVVEGVVEPVMSTPLTTPMYCDGVIEFLVEDGVHVKSGDLVCQIKYQNLETEYDRLLVDFETAIAGINKLKADLNLQFALIEAQVRNNEADTKIAQLDSTQLVYLTPTQRRIKQLELERVTIEKERYEKKLKTLTFIQQTEIKKKELEIQSFSNYIKTIKESLDLLTIRAPKDGLIIISENPMTDIKYQVGDPVWSNMTIAIIPEYNKMKVRILASEADYKYINVGDSVIYTFDAMPDNSGTGKILMKAPMGRPVRRNSKVKVFEIEASLDTVKTMPEPGFTTNCNVILKNVEDAISIPRISIFEEDSVKYVYVKKNKGYEMRQVGTGIVSLKEAIIRFGLYGDEVVSLAKPKDSQVRKRIMLPDSIRTLLASDTIYTDPMLIESDQIMTSQPGQIGIENEMLPIRVE